jgi:tetratricopeptide (TPR) repeat protein
MASVVIVPSQLPVGIIVVKVNDLGACDWAIQAETTGIEQLKRFQQFGSLHALEEAISSLRMAVMLTDEGHPNKPWYLSNLGNAQQTRFNCLGNLSDLENAISNNARAVDLMDDGHPSKPGHLLNLGNAQQTRFDNLGNLSDLENAISNNAKAVDLTDDGHPDKPKYFFHLGDTQEIHFDRLGNLSDLENAISNKAKAVDLTHDCHPSKPGLLSSLGLTQTIHFRHFGDLCDLENAISNNDKAVGLTDDSHPHRPMCFLNLGVAQQARFECLGHLSNLENAISSKAKAVDLMDDGHPDKPRYFSSLGIAQLARFNCLGNLSDLENAISNSAKAVDLTDDGHPSKPGRLSTLGSAQQKSFNHLGNLSDLENAITNKAKAVSLTDDGHPDKPMYFSNLGNAQHIRFGRLGNLSDLENAISNKSKAVDLTHDGHPNKPMFFSNLGNAQQTRFDRLGNLSDLENAILNNAKAVDLSDDGHPDKPMYFSNLGNAQHIRFNRLGHLSDLKNAISNYDKAVDLTDDGHLDKPMFFSNLGIAQQTHFDHLGNLSDLENAILNNAKAVDLSDDGHPDKPTYFSNLGNAQYIRFNHLRHLSDLENAISNQRKGVDLTDNTHPVHAVCLYHLGIAQHTRFKHFRSEEDHVASISSFKAAAHLKVANPHTALPAARQWATISHIYGDLQCALEGYRTALELLPKVVWLGLDTPSRQALLLHEKTEDLGSLAATCAIQLGNFEAAVELLDLSRSLFWQQAVSLRSDLKLLRAEDPELAKELQRVGHQLDAGNFTHSLLTTENKSINYDECGTEGIGKTRHHLVGLWEDLVEQVRQLPHFKHFLQPVPFYKLCQASAGRQIIVINVSKFRVDALVLGASQHIEHVLLPDINLMVLSKLSDDIIHQRPAFATEKAQRNYTSRYLKPALRIVWNDILVPIFNGLDIPLKHSVEAPQRQVCWYPTGPLTFIPLHAAGPWNRSTKVIDVSHLFASSYVTSLSSLLQSQRKSKQVEMNRLKLLAVSQPNTSGLSPLPQSIVEVKKLVDAAHSAAVNSGGNAEPDILHLNGADAITTRVLGALDAFSWVHFACHGSQHPTLGMKSAFALHDGQLELSVIASKNLPSAQFAFLSACHAAAGLKDLPGEAIHLAAGLQFAGFPSVIATMWSIHDDDAPTVAECTYKYLFRNGLHMLDPSEAATALNRAILSLRENPDVTVERWAPFIHFGI